MIGEMGFGGSGYLCVRFLNVQATGDQVSPQRDVVEKTKFLSRNSAKMRVAEQCRQLPVLWTNVFVK